MSKPIVVIWLKGVNLIQDNTKQAIIHPRSFRLILHGARYAFQQRDGAIRTCACQAVRHHQRLRIGLMPAMAEAKQDTDEQERLNCCFHVGKCSIFSDRTHAAPTNFATIQSTSR